MTSLMELYISFFQIGLFSIGGGLASLPLIQEEIVNAKAWLSMAEFSDLVSIAQMTPGPIALNAATFVGTKMAGIRGAVIATLGNISPSILLVSLLAFLFFRYRNLKAIQGALYGLKPASIALIASAGLSIFILAIWGKEGVSLNPKNCNLTGLLLFPVCLFVLQRYKVHPILVMLGTGVLYTLISL